ncbi:YlbL family protein [Cellulomonas sp. NS3]|uniref:YlbL family protein n=1 Tax=Cellulomonas sp. NS3 TaxID=2973977 RepID=UPI002161F39C|nr:PDZ domain-containing protein [Cellulomonas sp. NS3]
MPDENLPAPARTSGVPSRSASSDGSVPRGASAGDDLTPPAGGTAAPYGPSDDGGSGVPDGSGAPAEDAPAPASPRNVTLSVAMLATAVLLGGLVVLPAPYAVSSPGPTRDTLGEQSGTPLISIEGAETFPATGELLLTTVSTTGGPGYPSNVVDVLRGWWDPLTAVRPVEEVFPPDISQDSLDEQNQAAMVSSQENATVAALEELGHEVPATMVVAGAEEGSGSDGVVEEGDVLASLDGTELTSFTQLTDLLREIEPGTTVQLGVVRSDEDLELEVVTGEREGGGSRLGVLVDPQFELPVIDPEIGEPVEVTIQIEDIGGPSAGTMFALGIIDRLTPEDEAQGAVIAGTGTMDASGEVGPIGGIQQKLGGAVRDGATWFLAPAGNCDEVVGHVPDGLRVVSVATLHDAREAVVAIGAGETDDLRACS